MNVCNQVLQAIKKKKTCRIVAIEGPACSGKSTLAEQLSASFEAELVHIDDFFVPFDERSFRNKGLPMANIDWERLIDQILSENRKTVPYWRYDCSNHCFVEKKKIDRSKRLIVEGVSSLRDELYRYFDFSVFLTIESSVQKERLLRREPEWKLEKWFSEWLPAEEEYFDSVHPENRADIVVSIPESP